MKKIFALILLLISAASANELFGQTISMRADSVRELLCRQWVFDYTIVDGQKMGAAPGAPTINFEFKKDGTMLASAPSWQQNLDGTWVYDAGKKLIRVSLNKQRGTITSLKPNELFMMIDMKEATPRDPTPIVMVYKVKAS